MFSIFRIFFFSTVLFFLFGCSEQQADFDPKADLQMVSDEYWDYFFKDDPFVLQTKGIEVEQFSDITLTKAEQDAFFAKNLLMKLNALSEEDFEYDDQIQIHSLRYDLEIKSQADQFYWLRFSITPYGSSSLFGSPFNYFSSRIFQSQEETNIYLGLIENYAGLLEQYLGKLNGQISRGIYLPAAALPGAKGILSSYLQMAPSAIVPEKERFKNSGLADEKIDTLRADLASIVDEKITPTISKILELVEGPLTENALDQVGVSQYPNGKNYYTFLINNYAELELTPEEIHEMGLKKLEFVGNEMAKIRENLSFDGTKEEFHELLRTDPKFFAESPEELAEKMMSYMDIVAPQMGKYFSTQPKAPYGVKRLAPELEGGRTYGYYQAPTPEDQMGYYRFNGADLDQRSTVSVAAIILHELLPGHHYHLALNLENENLTEIQKFSFSTAFSEGWGMYASFLGDELGAYQDPYDAYGRYLLEAFLFTRLVVDTGMNYLGWSLEEGRSFMKEHTFLSEVEINSETLRYSTDIPGQALAYGIGYDHLLNLREKAQNSLGEAFDYRDFHDALFSNGGGNLPVLEFMVDTYIQDKLESFED